MSKMELILIHAQLVTDDVSFSFVIGETYVKVIMPYSKLKETVPDSGDLHSQVEKYINHMFNLAELL